MEVSFDEKFECPPGFQEEEVDGQLYHESIDDDCELWLIRMPYDVEPSTIHKERIFLSGTTNPTTLETENGLVLDYFVDRCEIPDICLVLPQENDKKLREVQKVFKGSILISEGLYQGDKSVIKSEPEENVCTTDVNCNVSNQNHEERKRKKSRTGDKELSFESETEHGDIEIKNESQTTDFDEILCHSQK